jgi:hypothetical protein
MQDASDRLRASSGFSEYFEISKSGGHLGAITILFRTVQNKKGGYMNGDGLYIIIANCPFARPSRVGRSFDKFEEKVATARH